MFGKQETKQNRSTNTLKGRLEFINIKILHILCCIIIGVYQYKFQNYLKFDNTKKAFVCYGTGNIMMNCKNDL